MIIEILYGFRGYKPTAKDSAQAERLKEKIEKIFKDEYVGLTINTQPYAYYDSNPPLVYIKFFGDIAKILSAVNTLKKADIEVNLLASEVQGVVMG